jgi:hypothetical protein
MNCTAELLRKIPERGFFVGCLCYTFGMNRDALLRLEKLVFEFYWKRKNLVTPFMTGIMGILIGLKPTTLQVNDEFDGKKLLDNEIIPKILEELGLVLAKGRLRRAQMAKYEYLYVGKTKELCEDLQGWYEKFSNSISDEGKILDRRVWIEANNQIGELLGYPKTATAEYIRRQVEGLDMDDNYMMRLGRNNYYIHSEKFEEEEFREYDLPLNLAIKEYLPKTAEIMQSNPEKRWLE